MCRSCTDLSLPAFVLDFLFPRVDIGPEDSEIMRGLSRHFVAIFVAIIETVQDIP